MYFYRVVYDNKHRKSAKLVLKFCIKMHFSCDIVGFDTSSLIIMKNTNLVLKLVPSSPFIWTRCAQFLIIEELQVLIFI